MRKKCYIYTRVSTEAQTEGYSLEHEHILTGLIRYPLCGGGMSGTVQRRQNKKTGEYKNTFYYRYHHRKKVDGKICDYKRC